MRLAGWIPLGDDYGGTRSPAALFEEGLQQFSADDFLRDTFEEQVNSTIHVNDDALAAAYRRGGSSPKVLPASSLPAMLVGILGPGA